MQRQGEACSWRARDGFAVLALLPAQPLAAETCLLRRFTSGCTPPPSCPSRPPSPGVPDTWDNLYSFFINRVRDRLHLVLCFSPVGKKFARWAQQVGGGVDVKWLWGGWSRGVIKHAPAGDSCWICSEQNGAQSSAR